MIFSSGPCFGNLINEEGHMTGVMASINSRAQRVGRYRLERLFFRFNKNQSHGVNVFKVREVIRGP